MFVHFVVRVCSFAVCVCTFCCLCLYILVFVSAHLGASVCTFGCFCLHILCLCLYILVFVTVHVGVCVCSFWCLSLPYHSCIRTSLPFCFLRDRRCGSDHYLVDGRQGPKSQGSPKLHAPELWSNQGRRRTAAYAAVC
eukprot:GHVQ01031170.1.p1 GENE.GHVQ01031170.1~~GHVQ01031170.1.p1  ORF type:complete len:138 (-),score=12.65 GHVQ01031170.1:415-828(-)